MKLFLENGCTADLLVVALVVGQLIAGMCAEVEGEGFVKVRCISWDYFVGVAYQERQ